MAKEIKNAAKTPTYQSAYHGEQSSNPLTRLLHANVNIKM